MNPERLTIAIDGPAGAGKSTVARAVASDLGYTYVDSGAMYRAATLKCLRLGLDLSDHDAVHRTVAESEISLLPGDQGIRVLLDDEDVSEAIRSRRVGECVSLVAQVPEVRNVLVAMQQRMSRQGGVVMDGRDIGTVVLPHADVKVFLTASNVERAHRRHREIVEAGQSITFEEVLASIERRDQLDRTRDVSPLRQAADAVSIDTTGRSIHEVVEEILALCRSKGAARCIT